MSFIRLRLRRTVLLPHPEGPMKPVIVPFGTETRLSRTARKSPQKILLTSQSIAVSDDRAIGAGAWVTLVWVASTVRPPCF
jgi:hypothetical protein